MASYLKRVQAYAGPVLLVYTALVTWLLITTAWSDHEGQPSRDKKETKGGVVRFLDVLVQEEKRHMRSFHNAVRNYRNGVEPAPNSGNTQEESRPTSDRLQTTSATRHLGVAIKQNSSQRIIGLTGHKSNNEGTETHTDEELDQRPKVMVEVEEWDETTFKKPKTNKTPMYQSTFSRPLPDKTTTLTNEQSINTIKKSLIDVKFDQNIGQRSILPQNKSSDSDYFIEFCDRVFNDPAIVPNICNRPVVELTNKNHISVSKTSLSFRKIGSVSVYSAFLDVRDNIASVRLMALAPAKQDSEKSTYWCIFNVPNESTSLKQDPYPDHKTDDISSKQSAVDEADISALGKQTYTRTARSPISFYAASDGHHRPNQFYILSCAVPSSAITAYSFSVGEIKTVQIETTMKNKLSPEKANESIFIDVIINKQADVLAAKDSLKFHNYLDVNKTIVVNIIPPFNPYNVSNIQRSPRRDQGKLTDSIDFHRAYATEDYFDDDDDDEDKEISRKRKHQNRSGVKDKETARTSKSYIKPLRVFKTVSGEDQIVSCIAPLRSQLNTVQIVEVIELSFLLGIQHLVIYLPTDQRFVDTRSVLRMYESRGLVTTLPWDLPQKESFTPENKTFTSKFNGDTNLIWARGRDAALNDCLYRVMHRFNWALFHDFNEFFVPRITPDLPSLLSYIRTKHGLNESRTSDLVFSTAIFPPPSRAHLQEISSRVGFTPDVSKFSTLKGVYRTYLDQRRTLRMIRPEAAFRVGAGERKKTTLNLSPRYAAVHHYSHCTHPSPSTNITKTNTKTVSGGDNTNRSHQSIVNNTIKVTAQPAPDNYCNHVKADWTMWRYRPFLIARTKESVRLVNAT